MFAYEEIKKEGGGYHSRLPSRVNKVRMVRTTCPFKRIARHTPTTGKHNAHTLRPLRRRNKRQSESERDREEKTETKRRKKAEEAYCHFPSHGRDSSVPSKASIAALLHKKHSIERQNLTPLLPKQFLVVVRLSPSLAVVVASTRACRRR